MIMGACEDVLCGVIDAWKKMKARLRPLVRWLNENTVYQPRF